MSDNSEAEKLHPREAARLEQVERFPNVAVTIQATGIHPASARIVTIDAVTFDDAGNTDQEFHAVLNPDGDPGPFHQHGLDREEITASPAFAKVLKPLDRLLDDRVLVLHNTSRYWGFIVSEARRAMTAAARANRARSRNKSRNRRRQKVGHVPRPVRIVDTLGTARRQALPLNDTRLAAVARHADIDAPSPQATVERARRPEAEVSRAETLLLIELYRTLTARAETSEQVATATPDDLAADRFGLQRSHVRLEATRAERVHHNPGKLQPGGNLVRGMEVVIAPEITVHPDIIIEGIIREELNYSEKLTRETSVVVCNDLEAGHGKAMHAARKGIPLLTDEQFLAALDTIEDADPEADRLAAEKASRQEARAAQAKRDRERRSRSQGASNQGKSGNRKRSRRRGGRKRNPNATGESAAPQAAQSSQPTQPSQSSQSSPDQDSKPKGRSRRRGGRRRRSNRSQGGQNNQGSQTQS